MDLNKVMLIGNLTRDPELRYTPAGQAVVSFGLATNRRWTDQQSGERKEQAEFHNIVAWGKLAETMNQLLKKGRKTYIEGRLQTRTWEGQDGVKKNRTEIVADNVILLDRKMEGQESVSTTAEEKNEDLSKEKTDEKEGKTKSTSKNNKDKEDKEKDIDDINTDDIPF
jgi:single-strand DNA-binding protein